MSWLVHLYTASGAVMAFLAAVDSAAGHTRAAFLWLALAVLVDATDGWAARRARVAERLPWFDGALLDNLVDYTTYVFVPVLLMRNLQLVPEAWSLPAGAAILLASAYGFSRRDAKTDDHFFTGFPSYWNIVVFYLWLARWPAMANLAILLGLVVLVFVPIRWVYPSRTEPMRRVTLSLGAVWTVQVGWMLVQAPDVSARLLVWSLVFPGYYAILSGALSLRRWRP